MAADGNRSMAHAMINSWSFSPRAQLGAGAIPGQVTTMVNQRLMERQAEGVLAHDLRACNAYQGGIAAAGQVRCPTLLVCGARDQMTPSRALAPLLDALAGTRQPTRVCMVPDCGHAIMAEAPDALTDALADFLTSI